MKKIAIVALLSVCIATPALADNTGKFYVAGDLGTASYSNAGPFPSPGVLTIAGGYNFTPMVAGEVGYSIFGDSSVAGSTLSATSLQIAAVGTLPLNPQFDLIGKIGLAENSYTVSGNPPRTFASSSSQSDLLFGLGAQFHVNRQVALRVQYLNYGKFDNFSMTASAISIGAKYAF